MSDPYTTDLEYNERVRARVARLFGSVYLDQHRLVAERMGLKTGNWFGEFFEPGRDGYYHPSPTGVLKDRHPFWLFVVNNLCLSLPASDVRALAFHIWNRAPGSKSQLSRGPFGPRWGGDQGKFVGVIVPYPALIEFSLQPPLEPHQVLELEKIRIQILEQGVTPEIKLLQKQQVARPPAQGVLI